GKLFSKLEKPYYTIVDDYVVFSNNPRTIVSLIEDYETGNTLGKNEIFTDFLGKFSNESTVFSYISSNRAFPLFTKKMDASTKAGVAKNEVYFRSFCDLGFQLTERDDKFFTKVRMDFLEYKPDSSVFEIDSLVDAEEDAAAILDSMDDVQRFLMTKFEHNVIKDYYGNSDNLRFEAETKRGELHGRYREFYETGELKVYGRYRKGEKRGVWYNYNKDGTLQKKEPFGIIGKMLGKLEEELE
ncbi:MAG: toxin-antitoxin system YwqK family antitoxin, partial [Bacteroidia bacterium]